MMYRQFNLLILIAAALMGCSTATVRTDHERIAIATDAYLVMPGPGDLTGSFNAAQAIVAEYEDDTYSFEAYIEARPGSITIIGLNAIGTSIFSIRYDGREMIAAGTSETRTVNAEYVLADVLLTHWDIDWLNARLSGASISVAGNERVVTTAGEPAIRIEFSTTDPWGGTATLTHLERKYVLTITTAEFEPQ